MSNSIMQTISQAVFSFAARRPLEFKPNCPQELIRAEPNSQQCEDVQGISQLAPEQRALHGEDNRYSPIIYGRYTKPLEE
jgi:hypothetical protein